MASQARAGTRLKPKAGNFSATRSSSNFAPPTPPLQAAKVFWLKKLIGSLLSPIYLGVGFLAIGVWMHSRSKSRNLSRAFISVGILIPVLAFNSGVADLLNRRLEHTYPARPVTRDENSPDLVYLAVLGGGHVENPQLSHLTQLVDSSRSRLVESVRLARLYPQATLLVCGPQGSAHSKPHAAFLAESAVELGISPDRIRQLSTGRDTQGEIQEIIALVGDVPVGIVTSAWHMPRAMAMARQAGINAIACPADYRTAAPEPNLTDWIKFYPSAYETTSRSIREYVGRLWATIRDQT